MFARPLTDQEVWNALPLSEYQREAIYNDFILAKKYEIKADIPWGDIPDETKEEPAGKENQEENLKED
jgi:hypothetical protein